MQASICCALIEHCISARSICNSISQYYILGIRVSITRFLPDCVQVPTRFSQHMHNTCNRARHRKICSQSLQLLPLRQLTRFQYHHMRFSMHFLSQIFSSNINHWFSFQPQKHSPILAARTRHRQVKLGHSTPRKVSAQPFFRRQPLSSCFQALGSLLPSPSNHRSPAKNQMFLHNSYNNIDMYGHGSSILHSAIRYFTGTGD